jgi:hypothetical protein
MSRLEYYARQLVAFDAHNKDHRRWYYQFLEYGGWGTCPVRFICPESTGMDLILMIKNQMIEYYVNREFDRVAKKPHALVAQKRKKRLTSESKGSIINTRSKS